MKGFFSKQYLDFCGLIKLTILEVRKNLILWELKVLLAEGQSPKKVFRKK